MPQSMPVFWIIPSVRGPPPQDAPHVSADGSDRGGRAMRRGGAFQAVFRWRKQSCRSGSDINHAAVPAGPASGGETTTPARWAPAT